MADYRQWWGTYKVRNTYKHVGPFTTREQAKVAAFEAAPKAKSVSTSYGALPGGGFDIRWHNRPYGTSAAAMGVSDL